MNDHSTVGIEEDVGTMLFLARLAPAVVATVLGIGVGIVLLQDRIGELTVLEIAAWIFLLVATLVTFFAWSLFPQKNLRILNRWFRERPSKTYKPQLEQLVGLSIVVIYGTLFVAAFWPLYYAIIVVIYSVVYYFGVRHLLNVVRLGLDQTRMVPQEEVGGDKDRAKEIHGIYEDVYAAIQHYHLDHKHLRRIGLLTATGVAAFGLALADRLDMLSVGAELAAILMGVALLGMEILISVWRWTYYGKEAQFRHRLRKIQQRQG